MTDNPISGREPSLGGGSDITGEEPFIGGDGSLAGLIRDIGNLDTVPSDVLVDRLAGVIPQLAPYLDSDDPHVRSTAARMIGIVAAKHPSTRFQTVPLLIRILDDALLQNNWPMIEMAIDRLGDTDDRQAALKLLDIANEPQMYRVGRRVQMALARLGHLILPELIDGALDRDSHMHRFALAAIGRTRPETHPALTEWLTPLATRAAAGDSYEINGLIRTLSPTYMIDPLIAAAMDETREIKDRRMILHRVGLINDRRATGLMLDVLTGQEKRLRQVAGPALVRNRFREDIPRLLSLLEHPEPYIRRTAIRIMGLRRIKASLVRVTEALADPQAPIRREAVRALRRIRVPGSVDTVIPLVEDRAPVVREEALTALLTFAWRFPDRRDQIEGVIRRASTTDPDQKLRERTQRYLTYSMFQRR